MKVTLIVLALLPMTACTSITPRQPQTVATPESLFQARPLLTNQTFPRSIDGPALSAGGDLYLANVERVGTVGVLKAGQSHANILFEIPDGGAAAGMRLDGEGTLWIADHRKHRVYKYDPQNKNLELHLEAPQMNQPNDLAIARDGSLFLSDPSWHSKKPGHLWRVSPDKQIHLVRTNVRAANGLDLSPDESTLYYSESITGGLYAIDLRGQASSPRQIHRFARDTVDGIRTDSTGVIYVTRIREGTVDLISPEGQLLSRVQLSGREPTNIGFGGPDGRDIAVTLRDTGNVEIFRSAQPGRDFLLRPGR